MQHNQHSDPKNTAYKRDVLGGNFENRTLTLKNDYEGKAIATLVRSLCSSTSNKAVLYIHGFNDYFFQEELATNFNTKGYNFYALDLRKYGRSHLPHQKLNNVRSLLEYDEELILALDIIKEEWNKQILLNGHSTGGLIITYFASRNPNSTLFQGLICNSPFYAYNLSFFERKFAIPILSWIGEKFPNPLLPAGFNDMYGQSLHKDYFGEWEYSMVWKPISISKVNLGFLHAIYEAQQNIQNNCSVTVPLLVLHSDKSIMVSNWTDKLKVSDAVLDVEHIAKYGKLIKGNVTVVEIKEGMHDLVLSKLEVRQQVYNEIFGWINTQYKN
ncbi:alpha/beta hydrolase [Flavobacterium faecale]|uniref:Alpha/beta hydrolase n=1 Tax=Flavobacterium faecale TaxID=1355330 RepID=A0A2S1LGR4_9FLAO|nr:alpha/beta hydrolase [Flavobacterium faecale]AWG22972.1 alpha/beta hydrolase [Flavobacterium faecale]